MTELLWNETEDRVLGVKYVKKDGVEGQILAPLTVAADGCFSRFRKCHTKIAPVCKSHFVGYEVLLTPY